jgi:hypothetical protein
MRTEHQQNWEGLLSFEEVTRYLPHFKSLTWVLTTALRNRELLPQVETAIQHRLVE